MAKMIDKIKRFLDQHYTMCWSHCDSCSRSQGRFWVHFKSEFEEEKAINYPCQFCGTEKMATYSDYDRDPMEGGKSEDKFPDSEELRQIAKAFAKVKAEKDNKKENITKVYDLILDLEKQTENEND